MCFLLGAISACEPTNISPDSDNIMISLEKCSATPQTITLVKEVAREMGLSINFEHAIVKTPEDAVAHRHIGSPTVQINGLDIDPGAREIKQFGVT
jgi:hypothetical protein